MAIIMKIQYFSRESVPLSFQFSDNINKTQTMPNVYNLSRERIIYIWNVSIRAGRLVESRM